MQIEIDESYEEYRFEYNDVCSYVIVTPDDMGNKDFLWLIVYNVRNADVYVKSAYDYTYDDIPPSKVTSTGKKFGIL